MAKKSHYAVLKGRENRVIVRTWQECESLVIGYPGAIFKGFTNERDAKEFIKMRPGKALRSMGAPLRRPRNGDSFTNGTWDNKKYPCLERGMVRCKYTGKMKKKCIRRQGPTMTGADYKPSDDTSVPWDE